MNLHHTCPDIYCNFVSGNFSFQKSYCRFSKLALNEVHEQNNKLIKGVSGATHSLNRNDMSGIERWKTSSPEIVRIIENVERHIGHNFDNNEKPRHFKTGLLWM